MHLEQKHYDMLVEHLPYEIDMMRVAYAYLRSTDRAKSREAIGENTGLVTFLNNAAIEAFWIHARNLLEFFGRESQAEGRTACAQDFTHSSLTYDLPFDNLKELINEQICHLQYKRYRDPLDKIDGFTMQRVMEAIDRAIALFEVTLKQDFAELWSARPKIQVTSVEANHSSATNHIFAISSTTATATLPLNFVTGPAGTVR